MSRVDRIKQIGVQENHGNKKSLGPCTNRTWKFFWPGKSKETRTGGEHAMNQSKIDLSPVLRGGNNNVEQYAH
jgi:hypothetical protein